MAVTTVGDWVSLAAGIVLVALALTGWLYWPGDSSLPMQWSLTGKPTWFAPRWLAFSLMPVIGLFVLALTAYASHQASGAGGRQIVIAMGLVAVDAVHLYVAHRSV